MKTRGFKNMPSSGEVRTLIYEEKGTWYGVALEFNIIETGDSPQEVMITLDEAIIGYVETAQKRKISSALNQTVDSFFNDLWLYAEKAKKSSKPKQKVYSAGRQLITLIA